MKKEKLRSVASTSCTSMVLLGVQESVFRSSVINYVKSVNKPDVFSLFEENPYILNVGKESIYFITYRFNQRRYVIYLDSICNISREDVDFYIRRFFHKPKADYYCCFNYSQHQFNDVSVIHQCKVGSGFTIWKNIKA